MISRLRKGLDPYIYLWIGFGPSLALSQTSKVQKWAKHRDSWLVTAWRPYCRNIVYVPIHASL